ncbi:P-loop NTPase family protein [Litoribacter populi]|uniref:hypothetical protein n=1 Tax=Litoribacter populi TaxID=2598460 RepID=UPI00117C0CA3|nr:hypothetical protein [Litoribacter populi]
MKVLGVKQFHQMRFKFLPIGDTKFAGTLGKIPYNFSAVIYGFSGNGKTEFCMQMAKMLCQFGKVAWLSYEQRHGSDLQEATKRNRMDEESGVFYPIDPIEGTEGVGLLEDLDNYLKKRNSPDFIFIDSIDYTGFSWADYTYLKNRYGQKKAFIFISHSNKNGALKKEISSKILFDGGMGIFVSKYIAHPEKNRFGGFEPYLVWEERARELNPAFFAKRVTEGTPKKGKGAKGKKPDQQAGLFENSDSEREGESIKIHSEKGGVASKVLLETEG